MNADGVLVNSKRVKVSELIVSPREVSSILSINPVIGETDAGAYHCMAGNSMGDVSTVVRMYSKLVQSCI